jgi:flagellar export protein FliJ
MKKFEFPLTTLLMVRKLKEEIAHRNLLEAEIVLIKHRNDLNQLFQQLESVLDEIRHSQEGTFAVSRLNELRYYSTNIKHKILNQKFVVKEAEMRLELSRQKVVHTMQERKIIENLNMKKLMEWESANRAQEMKENDEIATTQYPRKYD